MFLRHRAAHLGSVWLFGFVLVLFTITLSLRLVFNNPAKVNSIVDQSGIYNVLVEGILTDVQQHTQHASTNAVSSVPLNQPAVQAAIKSAFPPQFLEQQGNGVVTSMHAWLIGKTVTPDFSVDFSQAKAKLANNLAAYAQHYLGTLPRCTAAAGISAENFNPFTASCLPAGVTVQSATQQVQQQIAGSTNFLPHPVVTASTPVASNQKSLIGKYGSLPHSYQRLLWLPIILGILAVILLIVGLLIHPDKRRQTKHFAIAFIVAGVLALLFAILTTQVWDHASTIIVRKLSNTDQILVPKVTQIVSGFASALAHEYIIWGVVLLVVGIALLVLKRFLPTVTASTPAEPPKQATPKQNQTL